MERYRPICRTLSLCITACQYGHFLRRHQCDGPTPPRYASRSHNISGPPLGVGASYLLSKDGHVSDALRQLTASKDVAVVRHPSNPRMNRTAALVTFSSAYVCGHIKIPPSPYMYITIYYYIYYYIYILLYIYYCIYYDIYIYIYFYT